MPGRLSISCSCVWMRYAFVSFFFFFIKIDEGALERSDAVKFRVGFVITLIETFSR